MSCPRCGSGTVGLGTRPVLAPAVRCGRLEVDRIVVPRRRCSACGHVFLDRGCASTGRVLDEVVGIASALGIAGAAQSLGCGEGRVRAILRRWTALREGDVPSFRPLVAGLAKVRSGGEDRLLVLDADAGAAFDVLPSVRGLRDWISSRPGRVDLVLVPVDAALADAALRALPGVPVAVAPRDAAAAVVSAGTRTLAALGPATRNFREDAALLDVPDERLPEEGREEIAEFWTPRSRTLRRHVLCLVAALRTAPEAFDAAARAACAWLSDAAPSSTLALLIGRWCAPFSAGAGETWLDVAAGRFRILVDAAERRHGRSSFEVLRIATAFADLTRLPSGGIDALSLAASLDGP